MTGKNRHYIPRFYQGYFLYPEHYEKSYTKKDYHYYLSLKYKGIMNKKIVHSEEHYKHLKNKGVKYFQHSGQEFFGLDSENEKILKNIEKIEKNNLDNLNKYLEKNKNIKIIFEKLAYNFLNNFIVTLNCRSTTIINNLRIIAEKIINDLLNNNLQHPDKNKKITIQEKNNIKKYLRNIFLNDKSKINNEKYNFFKKTYNLQVKHILSKKNDYNFKYCFVVKLKEEIPLTDITSLSFKNEEFNLIEGNIDSDNLIFLLNKKTLLYYKNDNYYWKIPFEKIRDYILLKSREFIIYNKELSNATIEKISIFDGIVDDFYNELESVIKTIIVILYENKKRKKIEKKILKIIDGFDLLKI